MLAQLLAEKGHALAFNIVEVGAVPLDGPAEPFHALLEIFPQSRVAAIEIDPALCAELNARAPPGMRYYSAVLGRADELRTLYETWHPTCTSLYEPDERLADVYDRLDVLRLKSKSTVRTMSLDRFVSDNGLGSIDFIKMDIQGAELDVLQGASATLPSVLAIVSEVEFVPLYKGQPLYGDVDAFLRERDFMLHGLIGLRGRVMKSVVREGAVADPMQLMWSDALFTCDLLDLRGVSQDQLLKLAVLMDLYRSRDTAFYLLEQYDAMGGEPVAALYRDRVFASGEWTKQP